jgi:MFS family permease
MTPRSSLPMVVAAASAGTAFEYYDFLLFGTLAPILSKQFFSGVDETTGFFLALATFGAGFAARPFGGLLFGSLGDRRGRKGVFLATVIIMGIATTAIGLLPTYAQVGLAAPLLLVGLRLLQGFALGGEYGGAAIYVAEHAPPGRRGELTGWIQTAAAFGLIGALVVILATRLAIGELAFAAWGWRIPFAISGVLLAISVFMRSRLRESPVFETLARTGATSRSPLAETFGQWRNLKLVLLAFFALMAGQGAVWYTGFFYAQFFLERVLKAPAQTVNLLLLAAAGASAVLYLAFAWLSDRIGRKPVMIFGMAVAVVGFFPGFHGLTRAVNPALQSAIAASPVIVAADPSACGIQFDLLGVRKASSTCDKVKAALVRAGVPYRNERRKGPQLELQIGPPRRGRARRSQRACGPQAIRWLRLQSRSRSAGRCSCCWCS